MNLNNLFTFLIDSCLRKRCEYQSKCLRRADQTTECVCPVCEDIYRPICGSDGVTYASDCHLNAASCREKQAIVVAKKEPCGRCTFSVCSL